MKFGSFRFGRSKSKARHTSPVQQLVLGTQNIGRAHSLTDLGSMDSPDFDDRRRRGESEPPQIIPHPSSGNLVGRKRAGSDHSHHRSKPPRPSHESYDSGRSTGGGRSTIEEHRRSQAEATAIEHYSPLSNQRTLNELNDIVETLRNENAGLKEKVKLVESEQSRSTTSEKSKKKKKVKSAHSVQSLDSRLDFPVDSAAAELQKVICDLHIENKKLNITLTKKDSVIDGFRDDIEKLQSQATELKRQNLFYSSEVNDLKVVKEKLSLDLFSARHENGQIENDKMESIIQLERTIRELENDLQVARVNFDQLSREKASGISQIDHKRIIRSIQNTFEEQLKLKEVELLTEKITTAKEEEKTADLNEDIALLLQQKEEIFAKAETMRQRHVEEKNSIAPLVIENELLNNKNSMLQQRLHVAQREVENLQQQSEVEQQISLNRARPGGGRTLAMKEMMLTLQDDWRDVVQLIQEVELEKTHNVNKSFGVELKKLNNIALEMQQRECDVQTRENDAFRLLSVATLREVSQRKF